MRRASLWLTLLALFATAPLPALAEDTIDIDEPLSDQEAEDLARAVQNPIANLISLPFQNNTNFEFGPKEKTFNQLNIQPVVPFSMNEGWNVITRTIVPLVSQPGLRSGQDRETGLGDTTFTAFFSPKEGAFDGNLTWGVGPVALMPTATDDRLGSDKWGLGPSVVALTSQGPWVVGSLFSQLWSTGGSGDQDISLFTWQYFINYNFPGGLYLTTSPIITANWKADRGGNTWTVPFGGGVGKVFHVPGLPPTNVSIQGFYNTWRPEGVGRWNLRFQVQLLFPR